MFRVTYLSHGEYTTGVRAELCGLREPPGIRIEKEEQNHAEGHQVHIDEKQNAAVIETPSRFHAAQVIDGSGDGCDGGKNEERSGMVVGEVGEQNRGTEAEEDQESTPKKGAVARIEKAGDHRADSRVKVLADMRSGQSRDKVAI